MATIEYPSSNAPSFGARPPAKRVLKLPFAPSLEKLRLRAYLVLLLLDGLIVACSFLTIDFIYNGSQIQQTTIANINIFVPVYWTAALIIRAYSIQSLTSLRFSQTRAVLAILIALIFVVFIAFFTKASDTISRLVTGLGIVVIAIALVWVRALLEHRIRARFGATAQNVLVFDDGGAPVKVPHAWHVDTAQHHLRPDSKDPHMLDLLGMFMANMDRVIVSCPRERRMSWALVLKGSNISGEIVDSEVEVMGVLGARRDHGTGSLVVSLGPLGMRERVAKRAVDVGIAGSALILLAPLLLLVALLIRLEDRGPALFVQQRQGRNNRLFWIYKFRSMRIEKLDPAGARSASKDDDRITRIGRFIRRSSIDELPQLLNVMRGEMSIVGPRPHAIGSLAGERRFWDIDSRYLLRHSLKPGLTGLAQVRGLRGATDSESDLTSRLQADLEYLDGWSLLRDVRIIFSTLSVLVHDRAF